MELKKIKNNGLRHRLQQKIESQVQQEYKSQADALKKRSDFSVDFEYFLDILSLTISAKNFKARFNLPVCGLYCIQSPLELLDAFGFHPVRLCSGSLAIQRFSTPYLPALACPLIKSCVGRFYLEQALEQICDIIIVPTTCDWNTKLPQITENKGRPFYLMELPHVKETERGRKRLLEEIYELKRFLERWSGRGISRKQILASIAKYMDAWQVFGKLIELRRQRVIPGIWTIILANAFMIDNVESWTKKISQVCKNYSNRMKEKRPAIFLAGSPLFFPYLKIAELIEEAGMFIAADELCTSERILSSVVYDEPSEYGLFTAMAERYQLPCSCPTYVDNNHRVRNILNIMRTYNIKGVIYHLLKGCHPYDIESFFFEKTIKKNGFRFIKIETDYSREDRQSILSRLEAFKETFT